MNHDIEVTNPASWLARGRSPAEAIALAMAWRDFPDLPTSESADLRMARTRERMTAMRPIFEAMRVRAEAERQASNFAFLRDKLDAGDADEQDQTILRGRDQHGYDWGCAVHYAQGWYVAHAGWEHRHFSEARADNRLRDAYDRGFADGGGDTADLFDAARRANLAADRAAAMAGAISPVPIAKPKPSSWPLPSDAHHPVSWSRRLVIMDERDLLPPSGRDGRPSSRPPAFDLVQEQSHGQAHIVILSAKAGISTPGECPTAGRPMTAAQAERLAADPLQRRRLHALFSDGEIEDVLVTAQDSALQLLDALADAIPVLRIMERTRNSALQQRTHLTTWLARGRFAGQSLGAGHIRWSKAAKGLSASLGEFTVRHVGPAPTKGHLIRVHLADGSPATGYVAADLAPLAPELCVSSKARLRQEMAQLLRTFGGATQLTAAPA